MKRIAGLSVLPLIIGLVHAAPVDPARTAWNLTIADVIESGYYYATRFDGNTLYVGSFGSLSVYDISDMANPMRIGFLYIPGACWEIEPRGDYLYCSIRDYAHGSGGWVEIINVSNPELPASVGTIVGPVGRSIAIDGDFLYADCGSQVCVYEITVPGSPVLRGACPSSIPSEIDARDGIVYVARFGGGLQVIDATDPDDPVEIALLPTGFGAQDVVVSGPYALLTNLFTPDPGLYVVDVSTPSSPLVVSRTPVNLPTEVTTEGSLVFVMSDYTLKTYDASAPDLLVELSSYQPCGTWNAGRLAVQGARLAVDTDAGLCILDVSNPAAPQAVASIGSLGFMSDMSLADSYLAMSSTSGGLVMMNRYDRSIGSWAYGTGYYIDGSSLDVRDGLAFVGTCDSWGYFEDDGLEVFDISDPLVPRLVGFLQASWCSSVLAAGQTKVYIAPYQTLQVVDVSNAAQPVKIGEVPLSAASLVESGSFLYAAAGSNDFRVVDVSDPTQPFVASGLALGGEAWNVCADGNFAYVSSRGSLGALRVVDVSNPLNPSLVDSVATSNAGTVMVQGQYLYLADGEALRVFDKYNAPSLVEVGSISLGLAIYSIVVAPPSVYVLTEGPVVELSTTLITAAAPRRPEARLSPNRPNPFNPSTTIEFTLATSGKATIEVFDVRGGRVQTLVDGVLPAGPHTITWNGTDERGESLPSGVYFCRLSANGRSETRKMTLLK